MLRTRFLGLLLVLTILPVLVLMASGRNDAAATHGGSSSDELTVVSHLDTFDNPIFDGLVSDVWAFGDYAYVGSFYEPICSLDITGVRIIDISNPSSPSQVGFIKSLPGTRANDVKVEHIDTPFFSGEILVVTNEPCFAGFIPQLEAAGGFPANELTGRLPRRGGVTIYDVSRPTHPRMIERNFLDFPVHNTFIYQQGDNAYMLVVDDVNLLDVHIIDITKPWKPREIAVTGAPDWPSLETLPLGASFVHDVWVQENDGQMTAYLSYWDSGLVLLDITDPANPIFLGDSVYPDPDPLSGEPPEGNSHVAVPNADGSIVIMGDEDFNFGRLAITVVSGPLGAGTQFAGTEDVDGAPPPRLNDTGPATGELVFVGRLCTGDSVENAADFDTGDIAVIRRGACAFSEKILNAQALEAGAAVIANNVPGGPAIGNWTAPAPAIAIPALFVSTADGDTIEASPTDNVATIDPAVFAEFDGWGYMRVLDVSDPGNIVELGQFATENVLAMPMPAGDHTMHNVIVDDTRAYISWYADGMRVVDFSGCSAGGGQSSCTPTEVAHYVDGDGSNFWGVFLHEIGGTTYILGSDRDSGLWIFETP